MAADVVQLKTTAKDSRGRKVSRVASCTVADAGVEWSIDPNLNLTLDVPDPRRRLALDPGALGDPDTDMLAVLWGRWWRVAELERSERQARLTLQHRVVAAMLAQAGPVTADDSVTRPEWARALWGRSRAAVVGDDLYCPIVIPEATGARPPVLTAKSAGRDRVIQRQRDSTLAPGFRPGVKLTVKGQTADDEQRRVLAAAMSVCDELKVPRLARLALICALIVESTCRNLTYGDSTSTGALQLLASTAQALGVSARDVEKVCRLFLTRGFWGKGGAISLARKNPSAQPGWIAQQCQGSAFPDRYQQVLPEARKIADAWTGTGAPDSDVPRDDDQAEPSGWAVGKDSNLWDEFKKAAEDSKRRAYPLLDQVVWTTDELAMAARPVAGFARGLPGVVNVGDVSLDASRKLDTLTLTIVATDSQAWQLAGRPVEFSGDPWETGTWLVGKWSRGSRASRVVQLEMIRPRKTLAESQIAKQGVQGSKPSASAPTTVRVKTETKSLTVNGGAKGIVEQVAAMCREVGGSSIYVGSDYRPGSITSSGNPSDHGSNNANMAARDIGKRGTNLLTGPPTPEMDRAVVAVGRAFGRSYKLGATVIDTFTWRGYRIQLIWRTPKYGGHMGHLHAGARKI